MIRLSAKKLRTFGDSNIQKSWPRDKANLDFQWEDETVNGIQGETPQALMKEILKDLEEAMREFCTAQSEIDR